jgi:DNA sulfur modification protein DndD
MYFIGQNGNKLDINDFSAGESELVSFSLLWAVNETADINYPIITDSPFNRLDKTHRKNFINNILKKSKSQLIFLSTDEEISNIDEYELEPYIENTFLIKHNKKTSNSKIIEAYF